jgi:NitT/TauT family transport system substrate-binding protein
MTSLTTPSRRSVAAGLAAALLTPAIGRAQGKSEISVSRAYGLIYMVTHVIEKRRLIEAHAARLGVPDLKVNWVNFGGGGAQTDALLAGGVDIVNSGIGNLLLLFDRTRGGVKGIVGTAGQPLLLITRDPRIKGLADFGPGDKIAVPTVRVSTHAVVLQMAAAQAFGPENWARLDPYTVQMSPPDGAVALANPQHEVRTHFSAPPYDQIELKTVPGARVILSSTDVVGGPLAQAQFFTTTRFAQANPAVVEALKAATQEAIAFIQADTPEAITIYREVNRDKTPADELLALMRLPHMLDFIAAPQGTMTIARHLHRIGTIKTMPKAWTDFYLPVAHDLPGN